MDLAAGRFKRIGVLKADGLGDLILALPAINCLRRAFPESKIELLVDSRLLELARALPDADSAVAFDAPWLHGERLGGRIGALRDLAAAVRESAALRRQRYDLLVNLRPDMRDALLCGLSGARRRLSFGYHGLGMLLTDAVIEPDTQLHESQRLLYLLEQAGLDCAGALPRLPRDEQAAALVADLLGATNVSDGYVVLQPFAPLAAKNWPADRFVELARALCERGLRVVWIGDDLQHQRVAELAAQVQGSLDLSGGPGLLELIELLAGAALFVGPDSGPAHLAGLLGAPCLALFSGTNLSQRWRPLGQKVEVVETPIDCAPCAGRCTRPQNECMTRISVQQVIERALALLGHDRGTLR
ncbi:MAG: glycosyltransferase family 9 protein [Candidatus Alcyoniella australis]|nr:glycosyltransferase family 9 protein [Candidatus Alcyoniella australis]